MQKEIEQGASQAVRYLALAIQVRKEAALVSNLNYCIYVYYANLSIAINS